MTAMVKAEDQSLIDGLGYAEVSTVSYNMPNLQLKFSFQPGVLSTVIELLQVIHLVVSQTQGDNGDFVVGEVSLTAVENGGKSVLSNLHYRFYDQDNAVLNFPDVCLYHFHLEGDICVEAVSESYRISQQE